MGSNPIDALALSLVLDRLLSILYQASVNRENIRKSLLLKLFNKIFHEIENDLP